MRRDGPARRRTPILLDRGMKINQPPKIGRDGKWQLNLYDPDLTRVEMMEFKPAQTPCCSPMIPASVQSPTL